MTTLKSSLKLRHEEFEAHFALAKALEDRMMLEAPIGSVELSPRHINTLKSGLIIHLYNVEEAIMSQALTLLGGAVCAAEPRRWTEHSLREWLRESIVGKLSESSEDGRLTTVFVASKELLSGSPLTSLPMKKPSGTWDDKLIAAFAARMNITFTMPPDMWRKIAAQSEYGDKTPLQFLAERRNAIAHGRRSFEAGANDLDLIEIRKLSEVTLEYLSYAADAIELHLANEAHLVPLA